MSLNRKCPIHFTYMNSELGDTCTKSRWKVTWASSKDATRFVTLGMVGTSKFPLHIQILDRLRNILICCESQVYHKFQIRSKDAEVQSEDYMIT